MFSSQLAAALTFMVAAASAVVAQQPLGVITPKAGDVWTVGSTQTITWDTTTIPAGSEDATGFILLGYLEDGSSNEHLDLRT